VSSHDDTYHQGKEVCFDAVNNIMGNTSPVSQASRVLDDDELLMMGAKEPPTFADAERDQQWRSRRT
jgi:hypothetical protein